MRYFLIISVLGLLFVACKREKPVDTAFEATKLFQQSAQLALELEKQYLMAKDSMEVDSISKVFEKRITDINFSVPPQTDLKLTEQENDSLFKLFSRLQQAKELRLKALSHPETDIEKE